MISINHDFFYYTYILTFITLHNNNNNGDGKNGNYIGTSNANMVGKWAFDCFGVVNSSLKF